MMLLYIYYRDITSKKSHQCDCLNKTCIMTSPVDLPTEMEKISQSLIPIGKTVDNQWLSRWGEPGFSSMTSLIYYPIFHCQPLTCVNNKQQKLDLEG